MSLIYYSDILYAKARYEGGLGQLDSTQHQVTEMQDTLIQLQPQLVAATQDVQRMLADVEKESQEVAEFEKIVKIDETAAEVRVYNSNACINVIDALLHKK